MLSLTQADMERFEHGLQSAGWLVDSPVDNIVDTLNHLILGAHQEPEAKPSVGQARASL